MKKLVKLRSALLSPQVGGAQLAACWQRVGSVFNVRVLSHVPPFCLSIGPLFWEKGCQHRQHIRIV